MGCSHHRDAPAWPILMGRMGGENCSPTFRLMLGPETGDPKNPAEVKFHALQGVASR